MWIYIFQWFKWREKNPIYKLPNGIMEGQDAKWHGGLRLNEGKWHGFKVYPHDMYHKVEAC